MHAICALRHEDLYHIASAKQIYRICKAYISHCEAIYRYKRSTPLLLKLNFSIERSGTSAKHFRNSSLLTPNSSLKQAPNFSLKNGVPPLLFALLTIGRWVNAPTRNLQISSIIQVACDFRHFSLMTYNFSLKKAPTLMGGVAKDRNKYPYSCETLFIRCLTFF